MLFKIINQTKLDNMILITKIEDENLERINEEIFFNEESELYDLDAMVLLFSSTFVRREQLSKAPYPIDVTLLGMVIDVRLEQPENA